jgi:hypothetical protein
VLKIGAGGFPHLRILATGSSTLAASAKFRDTLTGRKRVVHLTPVTWGELPAFGATLSRRLFHGGLPDALLARAKRPSFYSEWMDSFRWSVRGQQDGCGARNLAAHRRKPRSCA